VNRLRKSASEIAGTGEPAKSPAFRVMMNAEAVTFCHRSHHGIRQWEQPCLPPSRRIEAADLEMSHTIFHN